MLLDRKTTFLRLEENRMSIISRPGFQQSYFREDKALKTSMMAIL